MSATGLQPPFPGLKNNLLCGTINLGGAHFKALVLNHSHWMLCALKS
jgi:hypothetical protein